MKTRQRVDYHEYLASREWRLKRTKVIDWEGGYCARCKSAPIQSIHHLTYETLGNEDINDDLLGVCAGCHQYLAGETDVDPALTIIRDIIEEDGLRPSYFRDGTLLWLMGGQTQNGDNLYLELVPTGRLDRWGKSRVCLPFGPGITAVCFWL